MAATPLKATAFVRSLADHSAILIVGGIADMDNGRVHASPGEQRLLRETCVEMARAALRIVLIGPAAAQLAPLLAQAGAPNVQIGPDLHWAAAEVVRDTVGVQLIAWVPAYPVELQDRERFADLIAGATRAAGLAWAPLADPAK
jgi:hypothetical protein